MCRSLRPFRDRWPAFAARGDRAAQFNFLQEAHNCFKKNGQVASELADLAEELGELDVAMKTLRTITLLEDTGGAEIDTTNALFDETAYKGGIAGDLQAACAQQLQELFGLDGAAFDARWREWVLQTYPKK